MTSDYTILPDFGGLNTNQIAVAASFNVIGEDAPDTITHDGKEYQRGMTASIPMEIAQDVCSVRIYEQGFVNPERKGIILFNEYPYKYTKEL
jgi:hypothetical protein